MFLRQAPLTARRIELATAVASEHPDLGQKVAITIAVKHHSLRFVHVSCDSSRRENDRALLSVFAAQQQGVPRCELQVVFPRLKIGVSNREVKRYGCLDPGSRL